MHGMVMLELIGLNPHHDDPSTRYDAMLDVLVAGLRPGGGAPAAAPVLAGDGTHV